MDDADTIFMNRALRLAGQGAGLVSPNPMVGAVLVKDGRIIGEGFHRYDRLRHAESYALEMAGELARGATLYCNLEPCFHHGRTPPCSSAVIEAGIGRAVIAAIDPDPRVSGRGVEQMKAAGIAVEVGLCSENAIRLNEAYLKYVTSGRPFVHAIINGKESRTESIFQWNPTNDFLRQASDFDVIALGTSAEVNLAVIKACLNRERHRKLMVAGTSDDLDNLRRVYSGNGIAIIALSTARREIRYRDGNETFQILSSDQPSSIDIDMDVASVFTPLAERLAIRSILALPGSFGIQDSSIAHQADKITVISRKATSPDAAPLNSEFNMELDHIEVSEANGFDEVTGYPRRNQAR